MIITAVHAQWTSWVYRQDRAVDNCQGNVERLWISITLGRSWSLGACNYPIFLSWRFYRPIYFWIEFISNSVPHRNLSDKLQAQARTYVDLSTWCRRNDVMPYCLILAEACSVEWNWPFRGEKYLKIDWSVKIPLGQVKKHMFLVRISIKRRAGGRFFFSYLLFPIACFLYILPSPGETLELLGQILI